MTPLARPSWKWRRRRERHTQAHFPSLTGHEALLVVNLFERVVAALWRAHGAAMADVLGRCAPDAALPEERGDQPLRDPNDPDDHDLF